MINKAARKGVIFVLLFFVGALLLVGIMLKFRMETLLTQYTENQTRRQAESFAMVADQNLKTAANDLSYIASKIEENPDEIEKLMPLLRSQEGEQWGLMTLDGKALYGDEISFQIFVGVQDSFRGNKAVTFDEEEGLLFTNPIFNGSNVKYVLYCLYPKNLLEKAFGIRCFEDLGKACVMTRDGQIVVPFRNITKKEYVWFKSNEIINDYVSMHRDMEVSVAAARTFSTSKGEQILFESEVPGTDFVVAGFVPKEVAAEGIDSISLLVLWVFGLLMLLVVLGAMYLVNLSIKLKESDELREAKAVAEEASKAKSDFLANMSHEIRTPINTVLGMNEMILREAENRSILSYADNIKNAGVVLLGLINDILDFSKIEAGKIEIQPVEYDMSSLLNDLVNMVNARAEEKGLILHLDFDAQTPGRLFGDEMRIKQIITNILTNAVKYTKNGSVTFHVGFEPLITNSDEIILNVSVRDTGVGIRPEDIKKLFLEFERIDEKKNRNIEGSGLGLSITKSLLEMMGSSLKVESEYGFGSMFYFKLRQKVVDWQPMGDYKKLFREHVAERKKYKEKFIAPTARVLVVDDNPMNLLVFESLIKQTMVLVDKADSGNEGILLSQDKQYDMIFLDHMMPKKDGIETLHDIRESEENPNNMTPAVCLTANAVAGAREVYLEAGFDDYLTKPIDPDQLEEMLMRYLPTDKIEQKKETGAAGDGNPAAGNGNPAAGDGDPAFPSKKDAAKGLSAQSDVDKESAIPIDLQVLGQVGVNVWTGIKNSGTEEVYRSLLQVFSDSFEERADELQTLFEKKDFENYTIKVHSLKSSVRIIGAAEFGEEAQQLENAGKSGDIQYINDHHAPFMEKYMRFKEPLQKLFPVKEETDDTRPEAERTVLEAFYEEICMAAKEMDSDRLESAFDELEEYRIPASDAPLFRQLKEACFEFDYDKIESLLTTQRG